MIKKNSYNHDDLIEMSKGTFFGEGNARLPCPNLLMFDEITSVNSDQSSYKGSITAKLSVHPELWFFENRIVEYSIMPLSLGIDAMFQLMGVYLCLLGFTGKGRAFGLNGMQVHGCINKKIKLIEYNVSILKVVQGGITFCVANGVINSENGCVLKAERMKVGLIAS